MSSAPAHGDGGGRLLEPSAPRRRGSVAPAPFPCTASALGSALKRRKDVDMIRAEMAAEEAEERALAGVQAAAAEEQPEEGSQLARVLSRLDLVAYGVGSTVGAGVFVISGVAAREQAGPALVISFACSALACLFSGLCYAEFSTRIPVAGSSYTYAYATLGELIGFLTGFSLVLEYGISAAAVARGWAGYVAAAFESFGYTLPVALTALDLGFTTASPLAVVVVAGCTVLTCYGVKESASFNKAITVCNMTIILFIIVCGSFYVDTDNWKPFSPYGVSGIFAGAARVFFSFLGFETSTSLAAEVQNPQRDLPIAIAGTLGVSATLYCAVALVLTGMVPYTMLDLEAPLSKAFTVHGLHWAADIVAVGSVTTLTATTLCSLVGQPRIFLRMARDGLFFAPFARIHPKYRTPIFGTIATGLGASLLAFLLDVDTLADMISIGTLLAFNMVCSGVLVLRYDVPGGRNGKRGYHLTAGVVVGSLVTGALHKLELSPWVYGTSGVLFVLLPAAMFLRLEQNPPPDAATTGGTAAFSTPLMPLTPVLGIVVNSGLVYQLSAEAIYRLIVWTALGLAIYFGYGIRHSTLNRPRDHDSSSGDTPSVPDDERETAALLL